MQFRPSQLLLLEANLTDVLLSAEEMLKDGNIVQNQKNSGFKRYSKRFLKAN